MKKCVALFILIFSVLHIRAQQKLYFDLTIENDSLKCYARKNINDSFRIYPDVYVEIASSGTGLSIPLQGNLVTSGNCSIAMQEESVNLSSPFFQVKKLNLFYLQTSGSPGYVSFNSGTRMLLFSCKVLSKPDSFFGIGLHANQIVTVDGKGSFKGVGSVEQGGGFGVSQSAKKVHLYADADYNSNAQKGIKLNSFSSQDMDFGACKPGLVCIVWDGETLERTHLDTGIIQPDCYWGRAWKAFGNADDYQIYYSYDLSISGQRSDFKTFLGAIKSCDYLSITSHFPIDTKYIDSAMENLMEGFGANAFRHDTFSGSYVFIGRKNMAPGSAVEQWGTTSDPYAGVHAYLHQVNSSCNLTGFTFDSAVNPLIYADTAGSGISRNVEGAFKIYPNPVNDGRWYVENTGIESLVVQVFSLQGVLLNRKVVDGGTTMEMEASYYGVYCVSVCGGKSAPSTNLILFN